MAEDKEREAEGGFGIDYKREEIMYSNVVFINSSSEEFVLDFGIGGIGRRGVNVITSIALSPRNAKLLYNALGERLKQYEEAMGEIEIPPVGK